MAKVPPPFSTAGRLARQPALASRSQGGTEKRFSEDARIVALQLAVREIIQALKNRPDEITQKSRPWGAVPGTILDGARRAARAGYVRYAPGSPDLQAVVGEVEKLIGDLVPSDPQRKMPPKSG